MCWILFSCKIIRFSEEKPHILFEKKENDTFSQVIGIFAKRQLFPSSYPKHNIITIQKTFHSDFLNKS